MNVPVGIRYGPMPNIEKGLARLTLVVAVLLALPGLFFWVASVYANDLPFARGMLLIAALGFSFPWVISFITRWIARGFSRKLTLPIFDPRTGEVTLVGYEPAGTDFPFGGAHATFPLSRREAASEGDKCGFPLCGISTNSAVIVMTPDGFRCIKHAGWYARKILIQHWAILIVFWAFTLPQDGVDFVPGQPSATPAQPGQAVQRVNA